MFHVQGTHFDTHEEPMMLHRREAETGPSTYNRQDPWAAALCLCLRCAARIATDSSAPAWVQWCAGQRGASKDMRQSSQTQTATSSIQFQPAHGCVRTTRMKQVRLFRSVNNRFRYSHCPHKTGLSRGSEIIPMPHFASARNAAIAGVIQNRRISRKYL